MSFSVRGQYRFDHWTADNGLPQNSVRDIVQTRDGYLWLTTFDGLVRFDGVRFTVFNKSNAPGIASNRFIYLFEDRFGDLWATLETSGLVRLHQGRFTTYTKGQGLPVEGLTSMGDDGQGNLIIFSGFQSFRWWEGEFQPADELRLPSSPAERRDQAYHLPWRHDGRKALCFVQGQLHAWTEAVLPLPQILSLITTDNEENLWLTTAQSLLRFREGRVAQVYTEGNGLPGTQPKLVFGRNHPLQAVSRSAAGSLWLTDLDSMQSRLMTSQAPEGLAVSVSYADREGNYWFGTLPNGLYRARQQSVTSYTAAQGVAVQGVAAQGVAAQGVTGAEVYPVLETRDGSLWVGTQGSGLYRGKDGMFTPASGAPEAFPRHISSLYEDRAGALWVNGVWRWAEGRFSLGVNPEALPPDLGFFWTMYEDSGGAYWIGTLKGVLRYQPGAATLFTTKDGLAGDDTKVIIGDTAGGLWLGSYGGLTYYRDGKFTSWTVKDGLPGNTVRALKQDDDGTLWIGTYDSGLGRFKDGKFTRYTTQDGLFDNGVFQMLEDDYGWLWMSCNRGIYRVRKQELNDFAAGKIKTITSLAFNKSDGMPSAECNGGRWPAGVKTRDGKLWFPTMNGLAMIDPASVKVNTQPPPVVIEAMTVDNQGVPVELMNSALSTQHSALQVGPQQANFEIQYTALSFINSENIRFKYKLEGLDEDWIEAGTRRTAYFSHVAPGDYTFKVIAANSDGIWNTEGKTLRLTVLPPFYRTWWFLTLATLLVGGAVLGAYEYRVQQLKQRQTAQQTFARQLIESQEQERKRIAAELHDSLSQSLVIIKNRALMALQAPVNLERATAQLEEIAESSVSAIDEVKEIAYALRPFHLDRLGLTKAIAEMVEKMTEAHAIQATVNLTPLDGLWSPEVEINLYRIVQESLNNIVKHAQATTCRVVARRTGRTIELEIADNGRGFAIADDGRRKAESSGTQTSVNPKSKIQNPKSGFGLLGMAERVRLLGGQWLIQSAPGAGTTITIKLSVPDKDTPLQGRPTDES